MTVEDNDNLRAAVVEASVLFGLRGRDLGDDANVVLGHLAMAALFILREDWEEASHEYLSGLRLMQEHLAE